MVAAAPSCRPAGFNSSFESNHAAKQIVLPCSLVTPIGCGSLIDQWDVREATARVVLALVFQQPLTYFIEGGLSFTTKFGCLFIALLGDCYPAAVA